MPTSQARVVSTPGPSSEMISSIITADGEQTQAPVLSSGSSDALVDAGEEEQGATPSPYALDLVDGDTAGEAGENTCAQFSYR